MRSDYKHRKPRGSQGRAFSPTSKSGSILALTGLFIVVVMVLYSISNSKTSQISVGSFSASINRFRVSNGYPTLSFDTKLTSLATKIAEEVDTTGKSTAKAKIIFQSNHLTTDDQLLNDITADDKNNDALLNPDFKSAGLGISNKTIVILLK